jgi:hypothetical protein
MEHIQIRTLLVSKFNYSIIFKEKSNFDIIENCNTDFHKFNSWLVNF